MKLKENIELQKEVKSTTKDAHLKNKQLLTIVSSIPFPVLLIDQFGNLAMHNNIDGITSNWEVQKPYTFLRNPLVYPVQEFIKDAFILEKKLDHIIKVENIEYQAISVPITAKNKFSGCLVLFQDITKALKGEKMQKRFIADASHELKTPISVVKGMVEILNRDDFDDDATRKEFLAQIEVEINRLDLLVKDLLLLSRLSTANPILERMKVDLCPIVEKACTSLMKEAQRKGLMLKTNFQSHDKVFCDEMRISQVIMNLITNAIKYSDEGTITIETRTKGSHYILEVRDQGCGIANENIEKIFDRFYRIDDDRSRKSGGSGLGLSIVKRIVDAHNGMIEVNSEYGKGTSFIVKLKI